MMMSICRDDDGESDGKFLAANFSPSGLFFAAVDNNKRLIIWSINGQQWIHLSTR